MIIVKAIHDLLTIKGITISLFKFDLVIISLVAFLAEFKVIL